MRMWGWGAPASGSPPLLWLAMAWLDGMLLCCIWLLGILSVLGW
jgi:hypothetical protein